MDLTAWREKQREGETVTLPSGLVMRLRRVGILDLALQGTIPAPLLGKLESLSSGQGMRFTLKDFEEYAEAINVVVKAAAVDPPVADEAGEDVVGIDELPVLDRVAVFNWANPGVRPLEPFRPEEAESL